MTSEQSTYLLKLSKFKLVGNIEALLTEGKQLNTDSDVIYIDSMTGLADENGTPMDNKEMARCFDMVFDKPIIGANRFQFKQGALCAVVKTGYEQGKNAAKMLLEALQGKAVADVPITRNYRGKRLISAAAMKKLDIKPRPIVLVGAELLKTEE